MIDNALSSGYHFCCTEQMSPEEPAMDWQSVTDRATNHLFFVELIKGNCQFSVHV